ncbi:MAG: bifunctional aspartate kinase/homoserine dehydrogenase I [Rikenellaceae bacterium]
MQVIKFGGNAFTDSSSVERLVSITKQSLVKDKTILVCSAIKGCTDELIEIGNLASSYDSSYLEKIEALEKRHIQIIDGVMQENESRDIKELCTEIFNQLRSVAKGVYLVKELSRHSSSMIASFGEILSTQILSAKLKSLGIRHRWIDSREFIKTDYVNKQNQVDKSLTYPLLKSAISADTVKLYIFPGFIASDSEGRTTTLGRGGSDYTASLIAAACSARAIVIWNEAGGMKSADPEIVVNAQTIDYLSYKEVLELSHFGSKVIFPPAIQPVINCNIPIFIKNIYCPEEPGTAIESNPPQCNRRIKGISSSDSIALISMEGSGMIGIPGYSSRLFSALAQKGINIILITQASSVHTMCIAIAASDAEEAKVAIDREFVYEISLGKIEPLSVEYGYSIISLVGDGMKSQAGISGKMFESLATSGVNIRAIAQGSSEKNVSAVVSTEDIVTAVNIIHKEFFLTTNNTIKIFIAGNGVVAKSLLTIISENEERILKLTGKEIEVCGISNSKKHYIDLGGIEKSSASEQLLNDGSDEGDYLDKIISYSMPDTIFVDCSCSGELSLRYGELLDAGINVVTSNKVAGSSNMGYYRALKESSRTNNCSWCYETTVGAALPIISTIKQMIYAGDEIYGIEAILSGTLNYLFSSYDTTCPFVDIVRSAKEQGYSETDPRVDISGVDVLRKTTILAREIGLNIEISDITIEGLLSDDYYEGDVEAFYAKLEANEAYFAELYTSAKERGNKLRFVANIDNAEGKAKVELMEIGLDHQFYNVNGNDNSIIITSKYYPQSVKVSGSGAGGRQTALGILNDIIIISK